MVKDKPYEPDPPDLIHTESPIEGGVIFRLRAWEDDPWPNPDEQLGERVLEARDNGKVKYFFHEDSLALEATLAWKKPEDMDTDSVLPQ